MFGMELKWDDVVIDKRAVQANAADLIEEWLWLVPRDADPMLPTACGDVFLRLSDGGIAFLDSYAGACETVAPSYEQWKAMLNESDQFEAWFRCGLICELLSTGFERKPGQCFSPYVPQIINGSWEPSNFHACDLLVHLTILGQIHRQVKRLPAGTKISGFRIADE